MNPLWEAIRMMSKEEVRAFKLFATKVEVEGGRKDLELFDAVRKSSVDYDEDAVLARIYGDVDRNTFHRLKSRLLDSVNRSLFNQYLEKNDVLKLYHILGIIDFYLNKRHFGLATWFLRKAERMAAKMEHHEALDIIYNEYIRLSRQTPSIDPTEFIQKRKANHEVLRRIRQLDDVLAVAIHRANIAQTYGESGSELIKLLNDTVEEYKGDMTIELGGTLRTKLFQAISRILLDRRDYAALETYMRSTYEEFIRDGLFGKHNQEVRLQIMTYLINVLNKNGKYAESLKYAEEMKPSIEAYDGIARDRYWFFYYNSLIINYYKSDIDKALEVLEGMLHNEKLKGIPHLAQFIHVNMALAWYEKRDLPKSIRAFVQTYLLDDFKVLDPGMKLRFTMAELIVRYELRQYEVLQQRIRQVRQDYKAQLAMTEFIREQKLIALLQKMNESLDPTKEASLVAKAKDFLAEAPTQEARDAELIIYNDFLRTQFKL